MWNLLSKLKIKNNMKVNNLFLWESLWLSVVITHCLAYLLLSDLAKWLLLLKFPSFPPPYSTSCVFKYMKTFKIRFLTAEAMCISSAFWMWSQCMRFSTDFQLLENTLLLSLALCKLLPCVLVQWLGYKEGRTWDSKLSPNAVSSLLILKVMPASTYSR